jgi:hypothetical protein
MSSRTGTKLVIALSVAGFSAIVAIMLIATGLAQNSGSPTSAPVDSSAAATEPSTPTPSSTPSPASTQTPYEQLLGQMIEILKVDGAQAAFDLLKSASAAAPQAAALCPLVALALSNVADTQIDWQSACP